MSDHCETHTERAHNHCLAHCCRRVRARVDDLEGVHADEAQHNSSATDREHATDVHLTTEWHLNAVEDGDGQEQNVEVQQRVLHLRSVLITQEHCCCGRTIAAGAKRAKPDSMHCAVRRSRGLKLAVVG